MRAAILVGALLISGAPMEPWLVIVVVGSMLMDIAELITTLIRRQQ